MSQYNLRLPYLSTSHYCISRLQGMNWYNYFPRSGISQNVGQETWAKARGN